ncbi:hypothetical protein AMTRI_Chr11g93630 [Amborella trichopoda]
MGKRVLNLCVFSVLFFSLVFITISLSPIHESNHQMDPHYASSWPSRMLSESSHCEAMASKNDCLKSLKCRWCRGEGIDDMCFSSNEAWRLPKQVNDTLAAPFDNRWLGVFVIFLYKKHRSHYIQSPYSDIQIH